MHGNSIQGFSLHSTLAVHTMSCSYAYSSQHLQLHIHSGRKASLHTYTSFSADSGVWLEKIMVKDRSCIDDQYQQRGRMAAQTLEVVSDSCIDTEDEVDSGPEPWGWLFPQTKGFESQSECY